VFCFLICAQPNAAPSHQPISVACQSNGGVDTGSICLFWLVRAGLARAGFLCAVSSGASEFSNLNTAASPARLVGFEMQVSVS